MTKHQKILSLLADREWICTNSFYASYIADPRTRIVELKKKGYLLEWRWCQTHSHNKSKEWRLVAQNASNPVSKESYSPPPQNPASVKFTPNPTPLFTYHGIPIH